LDDALLCKVLRSSLSETVLFARSSVTFPFTYQYTHSHILFNQLTSPELIQVRSGPRGRTSMDCCCRFLQVEYQTNSITSLEETTISCF